jgi:quercetin dioxygenase-like cupin family protein
MQTSHPDLNRCERAEQAYAHALQILPESEVAAAEAHIASCPDCQRELESLRAVVGRFVSWPTDVLRPPTSLQGRLALRIAEETGKQPVPPPARQWSEPEWEQVAPGIECKLLAADTERQRVSMLVRLAPGASYPAHTHAGVEELHLLDGELWIDGRKLVPGDYHYGAPGAVDERVWSETGCTCVLITSTKDVMRLLNIPYITRCGLPGIEHVPFGMHACHFYRNRNELVAAMVPYFIAGLRENERCLWITAPPLPAHEASQLPYAGRLADVHGVRTGLERALPRPAHRNDLQLRAGAVQ